MKFLRYLLLIFLILFLVPVVTAELDLNPLPRSTYNLYDEILVAGNILRTTATSGFLNLFLNCDNNQIQLRSLSISVQANQRKDFSISSPSILALTTGSCNILASFEGDQATSETFTITRSLLGSFNINPLEIQLGDKIDLTGTITKLDSKPINGFATIYFKKDNNIFLADTSEVKNGALTYTTNPINIPGGNYIIEVSANDASGNQQVFTNAASLKINSGLTLTVTLDKTDVLPGKTFVISGFAGKNSGDRVTEASVAITLEGKEYITQISRGEFSYELVLDPNIKSGSHDIKIIVNDASGNTGEGILKISIIPVQTRLVLEKENKTFFPKESINIKPILYDQANDVIRDEVTIEIFNPDNEKKFVKKVFTNDIAVYILEEFASPGTWKIKAKSSTLSTEDSFSVRDVKDLLVSLSGQTLEVKNLGNLPYTENLEIKAISDKEYLILKRTRLDPGESVNIELYKDLPTGKYSLFIKNTQQTFNNVEVVDNRSTLEKIGDFFTGATGAVILAPGSTPTKLPIFLLLIIVTLIFLLIVLNKARNVKREVRYRRKEKQAGKKLMETIKEERKPGSKQYKFPFGTANASDVQDYKDRILEDIKREEARRKREERKDFFERRSYSPDKKFEPKKDSEKDDKKKGGLFSMFD